MPTITIVDLAVKDPARIIQERSDRSYRITTAQGWNEDGKRNSCVRGGENTMKSKGYVGGKSVHTVEMGENSS